MIKNCPEPIGRRPPTPPVALIADRQEKRIAELERKVEKLQDEIYKIYDMACHREGV